MNRKVFYGPLAVIAVICAAFVFARIGLASVFQSVMAFPLEPIGVGLRMLSLSGAAGNAAAIAVYVLLALLPVGWLLLRRRKRPYAAEDVLLVLLSVLLFAALYAMVNPGIIANVLGANELIPIGKTMLGGMIWSVLVGYLVLRILRLFFAADQTRLQRYFTVFLYILSAFCVMLAFGTRLYTLLAQFETLYAGNKGTEDGLLPTCVFLVIRYLGDILPYLLDVVVLEAAIRMLTLQRAAPNGEAVSEAASKLSDLCGKALAVTVLATIAVNLLQLLCAGLLRDIHGSFELPILSVGVVLGVLLLARIIAENSRLKNDNRQLREDNDLFI